MARRHKPAPGKRPAADKGPAGKATSAAQGSAPPANAVVADGLAVSDADDSAASHAPTVEAADAVQDATADADQAPVTDDGAVADPDSAPLPTVRHASIDPFAALAEYERRSLAHVAGLPEQLDAPGLWRGVGYRIGHRRLASGFDEVVEILPMPAVTPVPGAQPWMLGVANIRGNLLPIVDLKQFLEGERTVLHESQRVLIVRQPGGDVAVTIDELFGQRSFIEEQQIEAAPLAEGRYTHFIDRAYSLNDVSWGIFSLDRLARTPEFRQAAA